jgi:hypothetical protein
MVLVLTKNDHGDRESIEGTIHPLARPYEERLESWILLPCLRKDNFTLKKLWL